MDQSVYVRSSIKALVQEGVIGAILCSLVILVFLGEMRMTAIAIMTLPISIMACSAALYFTGQTINVMTLAGMTLAIGPMIDSAIICLENTHRHLGLGATPHEAAVPGGQRGRDARAGLDAVHVPGARPLGIHAWPGAVPVQADGDGRGVFDDRRLHSVADAGARVQRFLAERARRAHGEHRRRTRARTWPWPRRRRAAARAPRGSRPFKSTATATARHAGPASFSRAFARWQGMIDEGIEYYVKALDFCLRHRLLTVGVGYTGFWSSTILVFWPILRREFFPEVDAGAFEMYVRAPSGLRIEETEKRIKAVEDFVRETIDEEDLQLVLSEIGVTSDWSAAYT